MGLEVTVHKATERLGTFVVGLDQLIQRDTQLTMNEPQHPSTGKAMAVAYPRGHRVAHAYQAP